MICDECVDSPIYYKGENVLDECMKGIKMNIRFRF